MKKKWFLCLSAGSVVVAVLAAGCGPSTKSTASTATSRLAPATTAPTASTVATTRVSAAAQPVGGPVPAGFDPVSFTAISASEYWLLGEAPCSNPVCTSIVRTTDGGADFVGLPAPAAPYVDSSSVAAGGSSSTAGINTLLFADPLDGYAFATGSGGAFFDTHDGGEHWAQPGFLAGNQLLAFGTGAGYALALVGSCPNGSCASLELERSPVGSDQWTALAVPVPAGVAQVTTMTVYGSNLWFSVTTSPAEANELLVAGTGSGASFATYKSPCFSGLGGTIEASSSSVLWAVCPTGMMSEAFRSTDGGAQWSALSSVGEMDNSAQLAPASDTTAVLEQSSQGPVLRTDDGGTTWQTIYPSGSGSLWWSWIGFTDSNTGSALRTEGTAPAGWPWPNGPSPEQLWRTADGGATWTGPVSFG